MHNITIKHGISRHSKDLSLWKYSCNWLQMKDNPPNLGAIYHTFKSFYGKGHIQVEAIIPQWWRSWGVLLNPQLRKLLGAKKLSNTIPIIQHTPPSLCTTLGMGSTSLQASPSSYPNSFQCFSISRLGNLTIGTLGILSYRLTFLF